MKNLVQCGTCGYPLTQEERTGLVEIDGVMMKPAQQEPDDLTVAYMSGLYDGRKQRTWVGLTPEEVKATFQEMFDAQENWPTFAEAIEAKLQEKNS